MVIALAHHEKEAFLKFFITYFFSVAFLILVSGFFYFQQMKSQFIEVEHFSLIEYARHIKMGEDLDKFSSDFKFKKVLDKRHINISNFEVTKDRFIKYIPTKYKSYYIKVSKSKRPYEDKLLSLKYKVIAIQILLLSFFAFLSYFLAKNALKPLNESIETLDKFAKDLIHDINTPLTAMKLNIRLLEKEKDIKNLKPFFRLKKSIDSISELRENLTILLEKKTFQIKSINICTIIQDVVELHQINYSNLNFKIKCDFFEVKANEKGLKQILQNIISNGCKYNREDGYLNIYIKDKKIYIEDNGFGIKEPEKIFKREYSDQNSSGLGLDIVKRLSDAMDIKVSVVSDEKGSCFILEFNS